MYNQEYHKRITILKTISCDMLNSIMINISVKCASPNGLFLLGLTLISANTVAQPLVTASSPTANSQAPRTSAIILTFSQPLTAGSAAALRVYSAQRGGLRTRGLTPATVNGNVLAFVPSAYSFMPGETVFSTVTRAVTSSNGSLMRPVVRQFTAATGGSGRGIFQAASDPAIGPNPEGLAMGDLDGDGDLDLLATNPSNNAVSVRLNGGDATGSNTGSFGSSQSVSVGNAPVHVTLGDVDNDGDLDVLTANFGGATVSVRVNNGVGGFSGSQDVSVGSSPSSVALGDIDGDGDLDLLAANQLSGSASVRLNNGAGGFSGSQEVALDNGSISVALGDVDGDGDLDIVAVNFNGGTLSIRLNGSNASGSNSGMFSGGSDVAIGLNPYGMALGDVDGDGDLDVLTAISGGGAVSVCLNNGGGFFSVAQTVAVGRAPIGVALGDVDADGDLDLFTANSYNGAGGNSVSVRINSGVGTFSGGLDVNVGLSPKSVALGDVDGDGDLDVLATNRSSGTASVRLNGGNGPLAIHLNALQSSFAVFPNPAHYAVTVTGLAPYQPIQLFDMLGRLATATVADLTGMAVLSWPINSTRGIYIVRAGNQAKRLVVE